MGYNKIYKGAILALVVLVSGCTSVEKAKKVMRSHPVELAKLCSECFPVKPIEVTKGKIDTVVNEVVKTDTVQVLADCPDGTKVVVDCPPNRVTTRVVSTHSTDTIKVRDTAYERAIESERDKLNSKVQELQLSRGKWRKLALWVLGLNALYFGGRFVIARIKNKFVSL